MATDYVDLNLKFNDIKLRVQDNDDGTHTLLTFAEDALGEVYSFIDLTLKTNNIKLKVHDNGDGTYSLVTVNEVPVNWDSLTGKPESFTPSPHTHVGEIISTIEGSLSVGSNPLRFRNISGLTRTISRIFLDVGTAPVGANIIVDIHKDNTTIFTDQTHRPSILANETTGISNNIDVPSWLNNEYLEFYIDQVGSATPGANLVIHVIYS
jgi:hypothetical protein